eukprot:1412965-Amphidinium_carterae.1
MVLVAGSVFLVNSKPRSLHTCRARVLRVPFLRNSAGEVSGLFTNDTLPRRTTSPLQEELPRTAILLKRLQTLWNQGIANPAPETTVKVAEKWGDTLAGRPQHRCRANRRELFGPSKTASTPPMGLPRCCMICMST